MGGSALGKRLRRTGWSGRDRFFLRPIEIGRTVLGWTEIFAAVTNSKASWDQKSGLNADARVA